MTGRSLSISRRTALASLGLAAFGGLSACSLRLEDDSPLLGPTAAPAPDSTPLRQVREQLLAAMSTAAQERTLVKEAAAAQAMHRRHLTRLDATLEGLGAKNLPRASATADPSAAPSPHTSSSASPQPASSAKGASTSSPTPVHPSAPGASLPASAASAWTRAESDWASARVAATIQRVSTHSRPLALAIAARSIAALPASSAPSWMSDMSLAAGKELLTPLEDAIQALEWLAATTRYQDRPQVATQLHQLYAVRSLADAGAPASAAQASPTPHRYATKDQVRALVGNACQAMASACATAASGSRSAQEVNGLVFAWSGALATQEFAGLRPGAFAGLAD